jgi:MFS family permease
MPKKPLTRKSSNQQLPKMASALVPREIVSWVLSAMALGAIEGGLLGVIVKSRFADAADPLWVNIAVAVVAGAPAFANIISFLVAGLSMGKDKIRLLSGLMQLISLCLLLMALPPSGPYGLALFCLLTVVARMAWSGILTVRAAVWRANFHRRWRGRVASRLAQASSLAMAATGAVIGVALDHSESAYQWLFPITALAMLAAARVYGKSKMRGHLRLQKAEMEPGETGENPRSALSLSAMLAVLRDNREYRRYMIGMMAFGSGNLMLTPLLVVIMNDQLGLPRFDQVLLTSSIPLLVLCFSIGAWGRLLDGRHILHYRAVQAWFFVAANVAFAAGVILQLTWVLWPAAAILGAAYAGGLLGWNLGHNDFASDRESSIYMAIHVSLTGARGLVMPLFGVVCYQWLEYTAAGSGTYAMFLPVTLTLSGTLWFVHLSILKRRLDAATTDL